MNDNVDHKKLRSDILFAWDVHVDNMYESFERAMTRHNADLDDMLGIIETFCGWQLADGFQDWYNDGAGYGSSCPVE